MIDNGLSPTTLACLRPSRPDYCNDVAETLIQLAVALMEKQTEQARRLLDEALPYSQAALEANPSNIDYLSNFYENYGARVQVLLKLHDHAGTAEAADIAEPAHHTPDDIYVFACAYAVCVKLAAEDAKLTESRRQELCRSYGDRAMNALRRAIHFGYQEVAKLKKDKDLEPLRGRDDFKKLLGV
jgi:hypothetical protein